MYNFHIVFDISACKAGYRQHDASCPECDRGQWSEAGNTTCTPCGNVNDDSVTTDPTQPATSPSDCGKESKNLG